MLAPFHNLIANSIRDQLPRIPKAIQTIVDELNAKLKVGGNNFMTNIFDPRYPLNLTTTQPPTVDNSTKIVSLNFEGTFYDTVHNTTHVSENTNPPQRVRNMNSNQMLVHQTMVASLLISLAQQYMPLNINDTNTTSQILQLFPEIQEHYGDSIEATLEINLTEESGDVIRLNNLTGIEVGKGANKL
jgi:hypothetical protein